MASIVIWSDLAETQLNEIHAYYLFAANLNTADRLVDNIILSTNILKNHPRIGQREESLLHRKEEFRYLVKGNYFPLMLP